MGGDEVTLIENATVCIADYHCAMAAMMHASIARAEFGFLFAV